MQSDRIHYFHTDAGISKWLKTSFCFRIRLQCSFMSKNTGLVSVLANVNSFFYLVAITLGNSRAPSAYINGSLFNNHLSVSKLLFYLQHDLRASSQDDTMLQV